MLKISHQALFAIGRRIEVNAAESPWIPIAPAGRFKTSDGKFVQVLNSEAFQTVVDWFQSIGSKLKRVLGIDSVPVFLGHPDFAPDKWPQRKQLGTVTALKEIGSDLCAQIAWNAEGRQVIAEGKHIYPSAAWDCEQLGDATEITPAVLWSVGLWHKPNIKEVAPILSINASPEPEPEPTNTTTMLDQLKQWLISLGLLTADSADNEEEMQTAFNAAMTAHGDMKKQLADNITAMNADKAKIGQLESTVTTVNAQLDERSTINASLIQERDKARGALIQATADLALTRGVITKAEKDGVITALNANFDAESKRLEALKPKLPTGSPLKLGAAREKLASVNKAQTAINAWCHEQGGSFAEAFRKSKDEPSLKEAWQTINEADKPAAE